MTDEGKVSTPLVPPADAIKVTDTVMDKVVEIVEGNASPTPALLDLMSANNEVALKDKPDDEYDDAHVVVPLLNSVLGKTVFMTLGSIGDQALHWVQPENPAAIPGGIYISELGEEVDEPEPIDKEFIDNARSVFNALVHGSEEAFAELHDLDLIPHGAEIIGHEMIAIHTQLQKSWA